LLPSLYHASRHPNLNFPRWEFRLLQQSCRDDRSLTESVIECINCYIFPFFFINLLWIGKEANLRWNTVRTQIDRMHGERSDWKLPLVVLCKQLIDCVGNRGCTVRCQWEFSLPLFPVKLVVSHMDSDTACIFMVLTELISHSLSQSKDYIPRFSSCFQILNGGNAMTNRLDRKLVLLVLHL